MINLTLETEILPTGGDFKVLTLGDIEISETGNLFLIVRPVREGWQGIELGKVVLVKQ